MATQEHNPPVFFAIAFVILIIGLYSKFAFKSQTFPSPKPTVVDKDEVQSQELLKTLKKLDYNKPISCILDDATSTVSAQMEGTNIALTVLPRAGVTQHALVIGDCLYSWSEDKRNIGVKKCGVGTYISMGKQFLGSGLLSPDMIKEGMNEVGKTMQINLVDILDSCKNTKVVDERLFDLPRGVRFQDEATSASK